MLDIKFLREHLDVVRKDLKKRQDSEKIKLLDEFIDSDKEWKEIKAKADELRSRRNKVSEEINKAKKEKKDAEKFIKEAQDIPVKIKELEEKEKKLQERSHWIRMRLPNIMHESVPYGKDDTENVVIKEHGKKKKFDFELKSHGEIAESLDIANFKKASEVSGAGFYYLKGPLALMEMALQRFAVDIITKKDYVLVEPPMILKKEAYEGAVDMADFEKVMYKIDGEDLYLIATSEHPMLALLTNETIDEKELPLKYCGLSSCFRREIGSHGVDTRGIFRVHQFNKIEQFVFCKPEDSWKFHEELIANAEEIFKKLEIPYRIVNICTGDLGIIASKKYDIEAWSPRQNKYIEVVSCSNCTAYQSVRANIKYKKINGEKEYLHTLNSTAIATSRALVVILENFQNKDGSVTIPKALVPYMNGLTKIEKIK
jgi:seryl-tRNA synthetase